MRGLPILFVSLALALALAPGCVEPDLGQVPFYCNNGDPKCPEGYTCVQGVQDRYCVRSGSSLTDTRPQADKGVADLYPSPELIKLDGSPFPDMPVKQDKGTKWDVGPDTVSPPDKGVPKPDGWPPHLGCQSHTECKDSSSPCCCPTPFVPVLWTCLPLCLDPFCI